MSRNYQGLFGLSNFFQALNLLEVQGSNLTRWNNVLSFDILLTAHLSIILEINQLDAQNLVL